MLLLCPSVQKLDLLENMGSGLGDQDATFHLKRNHQGLGDRLFTPEAIPTDSDGTIQRRQLPGGVLNYNHRAA
jgi:hypothetical protein